LHFLLNPKVHLRPSYIEGVETFEEAVKVKESWKGQMLGVRCPKCNEILLIFSDPHEDDYGSFDKIWGFCTSCSFRLESCINNDSFNTDNIYV
jgi:hypothetical protein